MKKIRLRGPVITVDGCSHIRDAGRSPGSRLRDANGWNVAGYERYDQHRRDSGQRGNGFVASSVQNGAHRCSRFSWSTNSLGE
jgi:hypothetical protein